jgi:DNA-binding CsgD family transcriptional regulator
MSVEEEPQVAFPRDLMLLDPERVPARWQARVIHVAIVPLLPEEASEVLSTGSTTPVLGAEDEELVALVSGGLSNEAIARRLGISIRSVQRRLGRLHERYGTNTKAQLVTFLVQRGFG